LLGQSIGSQYGNSIEQNKVMKRSYSISTRRPPAAMLVASNRFASSATDITPEECLKNRTLPEMRARTTNQNLRCALCQDQTIDVSNVPLERDHCVLVRERLVLADADEQAVDFIVARHGNFDLVYWRLQLITLALWIGNAFFVLIGAIGLGYLHHRSNNEAHQPATSLKVIKRQRLDELLSERRPA
jgi:cytochrome c-type biogenesis protein CcmH